MDDRIKLNLPTVVTDLTTRERTKYADELDAFALMTEAMARFVREERDAEALVVGPMWKGAFDVINRELVEVYDKAQVVRIPDTPPEEVGRADVPPGEESTAGQ